VVGAFIRWLRAEEIPFVAADDLGDIIDLNGCATAAPHEIGRDVDFVLSFGGDGTFLQTARLIGEQSAPIIGVNLGGFGYLAEVGTERLQDRIRDLLNGQYAVQERMMLEATIESEGQKYTALNDIVLDKGDFTRTIRLVTLVDGEFLNEFFADGLILSTSTGSTGYSLSAGGPILEPCLNGIIVNPICPHMLANRPLVLCGDRKVEIEGFSEFGSLNLATDGYLARQIKSGDKVIVQRSSKTTKVIIFDQPTFFTLLRNKLQWRTQIQAAQES